MATLADAPVLSATNDDTRQLDADPFWHSTPRHPPSGVQALMAAIQQVVPPPPAQAQTHRSTKPAIAASAFRRPQCTHMYMKRLYGHQQCMLCNKVPSIGWVYACQQDQELEQADRATDPGTYPIVPNDSDYLDVQARIAESLGMSNSVCQGIRSSQYSLQQVEKLIEQKKHLLASIRRVEHGSADSTPQLHFQHQASTSQSVIASVGHNAAPVTSTTTTSNGDLPMTPAGTPTNTPADSMTSTPISNATKYRKHTCGFQVCHACRPFFQDRLFTSFERILSGTMPALTEDEIARLPILNPSIVRNLGQRLPSPPMSRSKGSMDITLQHADDQEEYNSDDWTPTSATISDSDYSDHLELSDPYPCPGAGHCPLFSRHSGCAYDHGFDDGFRAMNHGFGPDPDLSRLTPDNSLMRLRRMRDSTMETPGGTSSTGSSISLPIPLTPVTPNEETFDEALERKLSQPGKARSMLALAMSSKRRDRSVRLGIHGKNSSSSLGSEVEVEGGVALTEEAVETGVPDILTDEE